MDAYTTTAPCSSLDWLMRGKNKTMGSEDESQPDRKRRGGTWRGVSLKVRPIDSQRSALIAQMPWSGQIALPLSLRWHGAFTLAPATLTRLIEACCCK